MPIGALIETISFSAEVEAREERVHRYPWESIDRRNAWESDLLDCYVTAQVFRERSGAN